MKPSKFAALAALAALTLATSIAAPAETAEVEYVFTAVDSVGDIPPVQQLSPLLRFVTGIVEGQASPQTVKFQLSDYFPSSCERLALMALQKPGRYLFAIKGTISSSNNYLVVPSCRLVRH
jgi:hypothetical protein